MAYGQITESVTIPSRFGRVLAAFTAVLAAAGAAATLIADPEALARYGWPLVFVAVAAWALFWRPAVTVDDAGVTLRNVLRTVTLPWPAIQRIDTKYALTLYTAYGQYAAWAAPAPSRMTTLTTTRHDLSNLPESSYLAGSVRPGDLPTSDSGQAALVVRLRWEALRDAGHLDSGRLEKDAADTRWHWLTMSALIVFGAAAVLSMTL